jgi:hypothetical protein
LAPDSSAARSIMAKDWIGMIPAMIGTSQPRAVTRSRIRR